MLFRDDLVGLRHKKIIDDKGIQVAEMVGVKEADVGAYRLFYIVQASCTKGIIFSSARNSLVPGAESWAFAFTV